MRELTICRPICIKGRPGTIIEITHGSILIDFELGQNDPATTTIERFKDVFIICECHIINGDRTNLVFFKEEMDKEEEGNFGLMHTRSIPFSLKN
jgi:hypothetical protein